MLELKFTDKGWAQYLSWQAEPKPLLRRLNRLIEEARRDPSFGIGMPERLSENLSGHWSRRITDEHRLIYRVENDVLIIIQCRYHY